MLKVKIGRTKYHESAIIQKSVMGLHNAISYDKFICNRQICGSLSEKKGLVIH